LNDKEAQTRFLNVLKKSGTHLVTLSTLLGHDSQFLFAPPSRISNRFQKKSWDVSDWLIKKKLNANGHLNDDAFFEQLNEALNLIQHIHTNLYENDAAKRKKTPAKKGLESFLSTIKSVYKEKIIIYHIRI
jgi:hypothetical protein